MALQTEFLELLRTLDLDDTLVSLTTDVIDMLRQTFGIDGTNIRDKGWPILFDSPWLKDITHLTLSSCSLDWQAIEKCINNGVFDGLESLNLKHNPVALPGIQLLLEHEPLMGLRADVQL